MHNKFERKLLIKLQSHNSLSQLQIIIHPLPCLDPNLVLLCNELVARTRTLQFIFVILYIKTLFPLVLQLFGVMLGVLFQYKDMKVPKKKTGLRKQSSKS
jgi:hypothetical protein